MAQYRRPGKESIPHSNAGRTPCNKRDQALLEAVFEAVVDELTVAGGELREKVDKLLLYLDRNWDCIIGLKRISG